MCPSFMLHVFCSTSKMLSGDIFTPVAVANGYLFLANIFNAVKIEKLVVPEVVQSGSNITLDCLYTVPDDHYTLMWFHNSNNSSVYKWSPKSMPEVTGVLEGRLDLSYKASQLKVYEHRALRILQADSSLSGEYTCVLLHNGVESRLSKSILIYSSESEFDLIVSERPYHRGIEITCTARGLYPQPEMTIEYNDNLIVRQSQRVWRHGTLHSIESKAQFTKTNAHCKHTSEVTCRIYLAQVDYTAIKKRFLNLGDSCSSASQWRSPVLYIVLAIQFFG